jgi:hypothetical protein
MALGATALSAQEPVRVKGTVVDEQTGEPVPHVDIVVRASNDRFIRNVVADDKGEFQFTVVYHQGIWLAASRIGYADNRTPILWFDDHTYYEVEIRLDPSAVLLAPLEVVSRSQERRSPVLSGFDRRVRSGQGYYITRREIESRNAAYVSDLLAMVPGVRLQSAGTGNHRVVQMARSASRGCPVQLFVDGMQVTRRQTAGIGGEFFGIYVDDFVTPGSVEGIEVYRGLSTVPPEFLTPDANCGVIAIWTRRGG